MSARRWRVGLTGGIASGKSTAAAAFAALGVPVIDLDQVARDVVPPGSPLLQQVFARFGAGLRLADGGLDRRALRRTIFADAGARRALEALLHPAIDARVAELSAHADGPYLVIVNPLLAERGLAADYDRVLLIDCDERLQRERLARRDTAADADIAGIVAAQATRAARRAVAHDVIVNEGATEELSARVGELHRRYLQLAADRLAGRPPSHAQ